MRRRIGPLNGVGREAIEGKLARGRLSLSCSAVTEIWPGNRFEIGALSGRRGRGCGPIFFFLLFYYFKGEWAGQKVFLFKSSYKSPLLLPLHFFLLLPPYSSCGTGFTTCHGTMPLPVSLVTKIQISIYVTSKDPDILNKIYNSQCI